MPSKSCQFARFAGFLCKQEVAGSIPAGSIPEMPGKTRFLAHGDPDGDGSGGGPGCMRGALDLGSVAPLLRLAPESRLRVRLRVLLLATDESQGAGQNNFGGPIGRGPVAQGLRSPPVSSVRRAGWCRRCFCPYLRSGHPRRCGRRRGERLGWWWARVTDEAKRRRQEL
jgi:hypothetical protein